MPTETPISADEARESLKTIDSAQAAGRKSAVMPPLYGICIAILVMVGFSLYAQESPGDLPGLFVVLGAALAAAFFRNKTGVNARTLPDTTLGLWAFLGVALFLLVLFFGGIYLRRAYDIAWIPVASGLIAGATILWLSASERRGAGSCD